MEEEYFDDEIFDLKPILPDHDQMILDESSPLISNYSNDHIRRQPAETYLDHYQGNIIATTNDNTNIKGKLVVTMNATDFSQDVIKTTKPSSSSVSASDPNHSHFLFSFENNPKPFLQEIENPARVSSQVIDFSSSSENGKSSKEEYCGGTAAVRNPVQAQEHVMAERKRRLKLGQLFITLSKTVPGIKKLDKASLLEDAINYTKSLQQRLSILEKEQANNKTTSIDESIEINRVDINSSIYDEISDKERCTANETEAAAGSRIKVRVSNKSALIKIWCKKQKEFMSTIELEMEKMNLSLVDIRVMPFGSSSLDITILAQVHSELCVTAKDIVEQLEMANFLNPDT